MKIQVTINGKSRLVPIKEVPKLESGEPLTVLLDSKTDGVYNVDTVHYETEAINKAKAQIKSEVLKALDTMRVEVDGIGYDGDEVSQGRMARAVQTLVGDETIVWKAYDNSTVEITQTELGKALRLAGINMTKLWHCTSIEEVQAIVSADEAWYSKWKV